MTSTKAVRYSFAKLGGVMLFAYTLFLLLMGTYGYFQAGSLVSLLSSTLSALWFLLALSLQNKFVDLSRYMKLGGLVALAIVFIKRTLATHLFFPAGLSLIVTFALLLYVLYSERARISCKE